MHVEYAGRLSACSKFRPARPGPQANPNEIALLRQPIEPTPFVAYGRKDLDRIPQFQALPRADRVAMKAVSAVLPFRVNQYVLDELIDWGRVPEDPLFQLTFPQEGMLSPDDFRLMQRLVASGAPEAQVDAAARRIQLSLNPQPAGQLELNVPTLDGAPVPGVQHKYRETVLFFPSQGQTCHAYCSYCFRWAQFVGLDEMKMASREADTLRAYLARHREVTDVLLTGGDPLIMKAKVLRRYLEPLLDLEHIRTVRIGTKAMAYWPYRFLTDSDADDLLRLFEEVVASGRQLAFMAHYSHPAELRPVVARAALRRIVGTGAVVRSQAPLIRHVNDSPEVWADLWRSLVELGAVPYYLFVERDTGAHRYFELPLARCLEIYQAAYRKVSGLARTARGPSMSALPGKVLVDGVAQAHGEKVFVLKMLQGRDPEWAGRVFFARFDRHATWLDDLRPAFGEREFFFEPWLKGRLGESSLSATELDYSHAASA